MEVLVSDEAITAADGTGIRDDRILPVTRVAAVTVAFILGLGWWVLYVHPAEGADRFAWPVQPEMTAVLMGSGYGSAVIFFMAVLVGRRWHQVTLGFLPTTVFIWLVSIATLLHWDRFTHGEALFHVWAWTYAITAFGVPALWLLNRRHDTGSPQQRDAVIGGVLRTVLLGAGLLLAAIAAVMYIAPAAVIDVWPWQLTELTARTVAAFVSLPAVAWLAMAFDRRWSAARVMVVTIAAGLVMLLVGVWRTWADFDQENWLTYVYVGGLAVTLGFLIAMSAWLERSAARRVDSGTAPAGAPGGTA